MGSKKHKFFLALTLGILAISGFAINVSAIDDNTNLIDSSSGIFKEIKNNPIGFINSEKISLPDNFDYIEQMNKEFVEGFNSDKEMIYKSGDSLRALEEEKD